MNSHAPWPSCRRAAAALAALALVALTPLAAWAAQVTFRYQPVIGGVDRVSVAGTFNGWDAAATPLADADKDGVWEVALSLDPGRYEYKFVVNGDQWFTDESAAEFSSDGLGGQNSVLTVASADLIVGHGSTVPKAPEPDQVGLRSVTFSYRPQGKPQSLDLAGTFNDWTIGRNSMSDPDGDGAWTATLLLPVGEYQYKFVVNGSTWTQDTQGEDGNADDGFGGKNSIRRVDDRYPAVEVAVGDGEIFTEGVRHEQSASEVSALGGGRVQFTTVSHHGDVEAVALKLRIGGQESTVPLAVSNRDRVYSYWRGEVEIPAGQADYVFEYRDGRTVRYLTPKGFAAQPAERFVFDAAKFPVFTTPAWLQNGIIYQIFTDRFRNGNPGNDQDFKEWYYEGKTKLPPGGKTNGEYYHLVKDWKDIAGLSKSPYRTDGKPDYFSFYGGDLAGVRQGLDYLQDLGITVIYFNPIFEAKSNHKYDCCDYRKIDPHFGTNQEFIDLVADAHARGIRVVLDIVYNHCGNCHWAFRDAVQKGKQSAYYDWFEFKRWPLPAGWPAVQGDWKPADYYYCWWGFGDLPDLNFDLSRNNDQEKTIRNVEQAQVNVGLVQDLLEATEYWLREAKVDGFRLDVPNEVPPWFWTVFRERVKKVNPDAYLVGELWGNAKADVGPHMFDAVMNYAFFRDPVTRFLGQGNGTAAEFDATLAAGRNAYPSQAVAAQMNLIDSHDTVRFLTQVGGDVSRVKLAALFGMTYVGAPHLYYGGEVAMEGGADPDCRRPFPWDWQQDARRRDLHSWYRQLIGLRKQHAALRTGEFRTVVADGKVFAYVRSDGTDEFLVVLNAGRQSAEAEIDLAAWGGAVRAEDLLGGGAQSWKTSAKLSLPGSSGKLYRLTRTRS